MNLTDDYKQFQLNSRLFLRLLVVKFLLSSIYPRDFEQLKTKRNWVQEWRIWWKKENFHTGIKNMIHPMRL